MTQARQGFRKQLSQQPESMAGLGRPHSIKRSVVLTGLGLSPKDTAFKQLNINRVYEIPEQWQ
jgi:hypothetical protein